MAQTCGQLFLFLPLLFLGLFSTFQYGYAYAPAPIYHDKRLGIRGRTAPDDHLDGSDHGAIPLVRIEHRHVGKRSAHLQLLSPSENVTLDWQFPDGKIRSFQYTHGDTSYVNLESLQTYDLLLSHRPLCVGTDSERSVLNLDFRYNDTYEAAKQRWHSGILFVIEDESCHEGSNIRSVYRSDNITFNDANSCMEIDAENLSFGPYEAGSAHSVTIFTGSLASLKKQGSSSHFYLTRRMKTGVSQHLSKRDGILDNFEDKLGGKDNPLKDYEDNFEVDDVLDEAEQFATDKISNILEKLEKIGFNFNESASIDFEDNLNETTYHGKNMSYGPDEYRKPILEADGHGEIWPNITLVDSYAKVHLEVSAVISFNIKEAVGSLKGDNEFDDSMKNMFENSLADFYVQVEAKEDLAIRLQAEFMMTLGMSTFCIVFLYPYGDLSCSIGPVLNNDLFQWSHPNNPTGKTNKKVTPNLYGINGFGASVGAGLAIWSSLTGKGTFNFTTPGVEAHIPKGSIAGYGRKNGETFESKFDGDIKWTKPKLQAKDLQIDINMGIGPALSLAFGAGVGSKKGGGRDASGLDSGALSPGGGGGAGGGDSSKREGRRSGGGKSGNANAVMKFGLDGDKSSDSRMGLGHLTKSEDAAGVQGQITGKIAPRLSFKPSFEIGVYARAEVPGFEFKVSTKEDVDEKCEEGGAFKAAVGAEIDLKVGVFAGLGLPGGYQIDTSWIKTGVKGMSGLVYHVNLWKHCWDITNTDLGRLQLGTIEEGIADGLNKERNNLTAAWYDHSDDAPANTSATAGDSNSKNPYVTSGSKSSSKKPSATGGKPIFKYPYMTIGSKSSSKDPYATSGSKPNFKKPNATGGKPTFKYPYMTIGSKSSSGDFTATSTASSSTSSKSSHTYTGAANDQSNSSPSSTSSKKLGATGSRSSHNYSFATGSKSSPNYSSATISKSSHESFSTTGSKSNPGHPSATGSKSSYDDPSTTGSKSSYDDSSATISKSSHENSSTIGSKLSSGHSSATGTKSSYDDSSTTGDNTESDHPSATSNNSNSGVPTPESLQDPATVIVYVISLNPTSSITVTAGAATPSSM